MHDRAGQVRPEAAIDLATIGPLVEADYPDGLNIEFISVVSRAKLDLRVWERGSGITEACGSGACAAVVSGRLRGLLGTEVRVALPGGELVVRWEGEGEPLWMSGPTAKVFEGEVDL